MRGRIGRVPGCHFAGDPDFNGIELQVFADSDHGHGSAVLTYRTDGKLDWYDPLIVRMNPAVDGPARLVDVLAEPGSDEEEWTFSIREGHAELSQMHITASRHRAWLRLEPPLPDLGRGR